jgi:putative membrane protein
VKGYLRLFLTGFGMGSADIVPGVSGGTIAFIFGIYEELVFSIKKLSGETLKLFIKGHPLAAYKGIPFRFLVPLGAGILTALLSLANLVTYLLNTFPELVWAFFFGLIVASILVVRKRVVTWDNHDIAAFLAAALGAFVLAGLVPVETPATAAAFFTSGFIAIIAMILPGISGSFLLVLMGKYEQILLAVVSRDVVTLGLVGIGAAVGISVFSRILSWLFEKHHDIAVATLTGFMVGSLRKVWPWKADMELGRFLLTLALAVLGAFLLTRLARLQALREQTADISEPEFAREHKIALSSQKKSKL